MKLNMIAVWATFSFVSTMIYAIENEQFPVHELGLKVEKGRESRIKLMHLTKGDEDGKLWNRWERWDDFKCPSQYGAFPDPKDCSRFYVCNNGRSSHKSCQKSMHFDKLRRTCLPRWIAVCDDGKDDKTTRKPVTSGKLGSTTVNDDSFRCTSLYGQNPHPTKCDKYYLCVLFRATLMTCPESQLFDAIKKKCEEANKVNCGEREKPTILGTTAMISTEKELKTTTEVQPKETTTEVQPEETTTEVQPEEITTDVHPEQSTTEDQPEDITTEVQPEQTTTEVQPEQTTTEVQPEETTTEVQPEEITTDVQPEKSTTDVQPEDTTTEVQPRDTTTDVQPEETTNGETTTEVQPEKTTTEVQPEESTTKVQPEETTLRPTGPPKTDCDEDDLDCIVTNTGEVSDWFTCPRDMGSYRHPSSNRLFIFCLNWKPSVKRCGQDLVFSSELSTCVQP